MRHFRSLSTFAAILWLLLLFFPVASAEARTCPKLVQWAASWLPAQSYEASLEILDRSLPTLVVIDGLSSGKEYATRAKELFGNIQIIHIQSAVRLPPGLEDSFEPKNYHANLVFNEGRFQSLVQLLQGFKTLRLVAGTETAPRLRARLGWSLGMLSTEFSNGDIFNNKALQAEAVGPYVQTIPGRAFVSAQQAWDWTRSPHENLPFPLVIKPIDGAGSYGVTVVRSKAEFFAAFEKMNRWNPLGLRTRGMLVQPYISHEDYLEFAIDAVVDPQTGVSIAEAFEYKKDEYKGSLRYLSTRLVRFETQKYEPLYQPFFNFAQGVARGLHFLEGVLHLEAFVHKRTGEIIFIEAGARPAGGGLPMLARACGGVDMITLHLLALFDRPRFLTLAGKMPLFDKDGAQLPLLGPEKAAIVTEIPTHEEFARNIPGFHSHALHLELGHRTAPSENLFDIAGLVYTVGSKELIDTAEPSLRTWESRDLYRTRPLRWWERLKR